MSEKTMIAISRVVVEEPVCFDMEKQVIAPMNHNGSSRYSTEMIQVDAENPRGQIDEREIQMGLLFT